MGAQELNKLTLWSSLKKKNLHFKMSTPNFYLAEIAIVQIYKS